MSKLSNKHNIPHKKKKKIIIIIIIILYPSSLVLFSSTNGKKFRAPAVNQSYGEISILMRLIIESEILSHDTSGILNIQQP